MPSANSRKASDRFAESPRARRRSKFSGAVYSEETARLLSESRRCDVTLLYEFLLPKSSGHVARRRSDLSAGSNV